MAFALQSEIDLVNQALDRISAGNITLAGYASVQQGITANVHYEQVRNSLFRSYFWNFARTRATLPVIETLEVDTAPTDDPFEAEDTLTGTESGTTCEVLTVISDTEYEIINRDDDDFEDGEEIGNGTDSVDCDEGYPVVDYSTPTYEWTYQYLLPDDYIRLIDVYEDDYTDPVDQRYTIEGKRLLTNYDTLNLLYAALITDPADWDALFREVFILKMALALFHPLAGTSAGDLKAEIKQELKVAEARARMANAIETDTTGRPDWQLARYSN